MTVQQGPSIENIPAQKRQVCRGCKFLKVEADVRGRFVWSGTYICQHPVNTNNRGSLWSEGRLIEARAEEMPNTPHWCPFLTAKAESND